MLRNGLMIYTVIRSIEIKEVVNQHSGRIYQPIIVQSFPSRIGMKVVITIMEAFPRQILYMILSLILN